MSYLELVMTIGCFTALGVPYAYRSRQLHYGWIRTICAMSGFFALGVLFAGWKFLALNDITPKVPAGLAMLLFMLSPTLILGFAVLTQWGISTEANYKLDTFLKIVAGVGIIVFTTLCTIGLTAL